MKVFKYPPPNLLVEGKPFYVEQVKRLKPYFPKGSRLELEYDPDVEGFCDLFIRYQAKPKGRWREIGYVQGAMTFKYLPPGSSGEFIGWIHDLYHDKVDVKNSKVDALYQDCMT